VSRGRPQVDLDALREATWSGCPPPLRADCWRLLLGYLPPSRDRRWAAALAQLQHGLHPQ
jgi:hypothetical protein